MPSVSTSMQHGHNHFPSLQTNDVNITSFSNDIIINNMTSDIIPNAANHEVLPNSPSEKPSQPTMNQANEQVHLTASTYFHRSYPEQILDFYTK